MLEEWLAETELKVVRSDVGDISETRAELEKFRTFFKHIVSQGQLVRSN